MSCRKCGGGNGRVQKTHRVIEYKSRLLAERLQIEQVRYELGVWVYAANDVACLLEAHPHVVVVHMEEGVEQVSVCLCMIHDEDRGGEGEQVTRFCCS